MNKKIDMSPLSPVNKSHSEPSGVVRRSGSPREEVIKVINNQALFENGPSIAGINPRSFNDENNQDKSVYYGTGLTTPKAPAVGLPFDVLGMMLVSEQVRKAGKFGKIIHHIADTHAKTNTFINHQEVDKLANSVQEAVQRAAKNLGLNNLKVVKSSEFDSTEAYKKKLADFRQKSDKHEYVVREMTDIDHYQEAEGLAVKLGWIIQGSETAAGADERLFDEEYKRIVGPDNKMTFLYTKPGRTFDPSRPKVSPYIQVEGERRILLKKGEEVARKIEEAVSVTGDRSLGGAVKHLEGIVKTYEKLREPFPKDMSLEQKVQAIIDIATK